MAAALNSQGHFQVEGPAPELAQTTTHSVSPIVCRRQRGQPMLGGLGVSQDSPGDLHHAHCQRAIGLAQYQVVHDLSLGFTKQGSLPPHTWSPQIRT